MQQIIHARIFFEDGMYTADCGDIPVVTQGKTFDEVIENLKEAVELFLEDEQDRKQYHLTHTPSILVNYELLPEYA